MDKIMEKINKLSLPAVILIASIILGGFYYASEINKQKSIEKQQQIEIQTKREAERAKKDQENQATLGKMFCADEAERTAIEEYKDYCTKDNYCTYKEGTFLTAQYENAYSRCLQRKGLK